MKLKFAIFPEHMVYLQLGSSLRSIVKSALVTWYFVELYKFSIVSLTNKWWICQNSSNLPPLTLKITTNLRASKHFT